MLHRLRRCLFVALANLTQHKMRLFVALAGTAVPIVLLALQIASLNAARIQVTRLYDDFRFDLVIVPSTYQFLVAGGTFDRVRFTQARAVPGVAGTFALNVDPNFWMDNSNERRSSLLLIGLDDTPGFVRDNEIARGMAALTGTRTALVDEFSSSDYGKLTPGTEATIGPQSVTIAGQFQLGLFFYADGGAIVKNDAFPQLSGHDPREVSIGLIQLAPGADAEKVKAALAATLPDDVRVMTKDALIQQERSFFIGTKPIGIVLSISMWIAFIVGAVILWQVLSADIVNRMKEFATMKAMGFSHSFVLGVGLFQAAFLALGAFLPALIVAALILAVIERLTHLPTSITPGLSGMVLGIVLSMCLLAAFSALRRIARAAPAELYR
jgi:putative ABC transport system permease protein